MLAALKPRGNPLAAGLSGDADPADGVTVRLYESTGSPALARVRLHGGLRDPAVTDVLERPPRRGRRSRPTARTCRRRWPPPTWSPSPR